MCRRFNLKFIPQIIPDVILIKPTLREDDRGYFVETFRKDLFEEATGHKVDFIQDNESKSSKGVLRGLHYQLPPYSQSKLVRVINGKVLDIALDIRKSSPTFGQHVAVELTGENKHQLFIPHGFAHGFVILSHSATFSYKVNNYYAPEYDRGIMFDDKDLTIDWKLPHENLQLSEKDKSHPNLINVKELFE
jgi:dTDP-4-dehydrorhamnose 3,5-epimerase